MAIDIVVLRGEGDKEGEVIQNPLISSLPAALARGAMELSEADDTETVTLDVMYTPAAAIGHIVAVDDSNYGQVWAGIVVEVGHGKGNAAPRTLLTVRRQVWQTS